VPVKELAAWRAAWASRLIDDRHLVDNWLAIVVDLHRIDPGDADPEALVSRPLVFTA
jgi:hypothetical protein